MKKNLALFLLALLCMTLAGCSQADIPAKSGQNQDVQTESSVLKGDVDSDICKYFSADFVYSATGKPVVKVEPDWIFPQQACRYYFSYDPNLYPKFEDPRFRAGGQLIFMMVENLSVANQKKGLDILEATYKSEPRIKMENMATFRKDGSLRDIRLIINPNRYVRLETNSGASGITAEELIQFAIKAAEKIQGSLSFAIKENPVKLLEDKPADLGSSQQAAAESFMKLLSEKKFSDALAMMDATEQIKSMWQTNFNAIKSLEVKKVEEYFKEEWTPERQIFKFTLNVSVTPEGQQLGWENGTNIRWISLQKNGDIWQVHEIANNP